MVSQEGDVFASTDQGVLYELHFGSVFTGNEQEVEAGFIKKPDAEGEKKEESKPESTDPKDGDKPDSKKIRSRYLFVQAQFDPEALGAKPDAPVKPEPPAEDAAEKKDIPADANSSENDPAKAADPKKSYEAAMTLYDADMKKYEDDLKAYNEKVKAGEKLVKDLNRRFADWYYVISGESFENLRQGRTTLVKEKTAEPPADQAKPADTAPVQP